MVEKDKRTTMWLFDPLLIYKEFIFCFDCDLKKAAVLSELTDFFRESKETWPEDIVDDQWFSFSHENMAKSMEFPLDIFERTIRSLEKDGILRSRAINGSRFLSINNNKISEILRLKLQAKMED